MQTVAYVTEQLDNQIDLLSQQIADSQKTEQELLEQKQRLLAKREFIKLNEEIYTQNLKTNFTKKELQKKFKMGDETFSDLKKIGRLKPVDKIGRSYIYDLAQFEQAREDYKLWKKQRQSYATNKGGTI